MKIAFSSRGPNRESPLDPRFGRAPFFLMYTEEDENWETVGNEQNVQSVQGAGIQAASTVVNAGCNTVVSGHCGPKAFGALSRAGVAVFTASGGSVKEALEAYRAGTLRKIESADVDGHW